MTVMAMSTAADNGELIEQAAALGYIEGRVLGEDAVVEECLDCWGAWERPKGTGRKEIL